ncbi:MAG: DUF6288 domain-containing protein, partial [Kiritimatiellia bacterium]
RDFVIQNFGPVGIGINLTKPPFTMVIRNVEAGSPAALTGKLQKGQIIESINGVVLKDRDPREILGDIITAAEATDGVIRLKIKDLGDVVVNIPVMGSYSETWPINCPKSDKIVRKLADVLATQDHSRWGAALFLLSTGEEKDLDVVRRWFADAERIGGMAWDAGYKGIAYCEYYLRTGDKSVLPAIQDMADFLRDNLYNGGWSGRPGASFGYSTGSGQMHAAGVHAVTFLMLAKLCGVDVDAYTLQESLKAFFRFAGRENVPYGDGWPEGGFRDNGKSAGLAVAMAAAARLTPEGENSIYAEARDHVGMKGLYATSWFHAAHTGGGIGEIWRHKAMSMFHESRPVQYRSFLDTRRWVMELSRRHDGSIGIAGFLDRYDTSTTEHERAWGNFFALTYTIPRKNLVLFGAPLPAWAHTYELPERPWGRPSDDAFVRTTPVPSNRGLLTMDDMLQERVETDASLAFFEKLNEADVSKQFLAKYLLHPEIGYRAEVVRRIVALEHDEIVVPLLRSNDPRLRHAGVMAISGMFKGRPLPGNRLTADMFEQIGRMIEDPDESLWVIQEALKAIKRADVEVVARHRDTILQYMEHEDWFLRTRAIEALQLIWTHPDHYKAVLPLIFKTLAAFTTNSALHPAFELRKQLEGASADIKQFAMDQLIAAYQVSPDRMTFPGGYVVSDGARVVRERLTHVMAGLPGGEAYAKAQPKMTIAAVHSGDENDLYQYSGTFTPNKAFEGTWHWALWPRPKSEAEFEERAKAWAARRGGPEPGKDTLHLRGNGSVRSGSFRGHFWSDNMLISINESIARKMEIRTVDGVDFLIIESRGFDPFDENPPTAYDQRYTFYMRVKE